MFITILGRQPQLGIAELERTYGDVRWFSDHTALVAQPMPHINHLGGTLKAGRVVHTLPRCDWHQASAKLIAAYGAAWSHHDGKLTLGISAYGFDTTARDVQKTGIILKAKLKKAGVSLRLIPNTDPALSTATSHHNKLGQADNKVELLVVRSTDGTVIIAESIGAQNITALAKRDQGRPKRDAFVGMLPPKLAQIMINLAQPVSSRSDRILDPFCGTGVILQEAALMGYSVYGTDLSEKMVSYSRDNLAWLTDAFHVSFDWDVHEGDAMDTTWQQPISAVVCESYLGQPFSAPPSPTKLQEVRGNCNHIISHFLKNIASQLSSGTPLCVAVPAWRDKSGGFVHLPLITAVGQLGFQQVAFRTISPDQLLYYREDQIVARELLVLVKR